MDDEKLNEIIDAWVAYQDSARSDRESFWWAVETIMGWSVPPMGNPEMLWRFIITAYKRNLSDKAVATLAAGALEDLIANYGAEYIERIETLSRQDPRFNYLLGGVWKRGAPDEIWARVERIRNTVW